MSDPIDFWFDFSSPYGYFAAERIEAIAARHGRTVRWHPVLLGAIFKATGAQPLTQIPLKGEYARRDWARIGRETGIPFRMPSTFPIGAQVPSRALLLVQRGDPSAAARFARALYRAYLAEDRDISDAQVVLQVAAECGFDRAQIEGGLQDPALKDALREKVADAQARGVFGSPFVIADGEPYWGWDRLPMLDAALARVSGAARVEATHLRWLVDDLDGMRAFYRDVLGFYEAFATPHYAEMDSGGMRIALYRRAQMEALVEAALPAGRDAVATLRVSDVDEAHARFVRRGARSLKAPHDQPVWGLRAAHLEDPAGHVVELNAPLSAGQAQEAR